MTAKMTASFQMTPAIDIPRLKTNADVERPHDPETNETYAPCQWKRCQRTTMHLTLTSKGPRAFCEDHRIEYAIWADRVSKGAPAHAHNLIIQPANVWRDYVWATCTDCDFGKKLTSYIDPKKFWVSATRETARNRYQNDDDEARADATADLSQALEDDFRTTGHDAYGHPYADPPTFDSQPNELLFLAPQGFLTYETDHCRHQSAYEDRTYPVGRDANDDLIYVTEEADGFCQRCEEYVEHRPTPQPTIPPTSADWRVRARREAGQRAADRVEAARSRREAARARREQGEANIEAARAEMQAFIAEHQPDAPQLELGI